MTVSSPSSFYRENGPTPSVGVELEVALAAVNTSAAAARDAAEAALAAASSATNQANLASGSASSAVATVQASVTSALSTISTTVQGASTAATDASQTASTSANSAAGSASTATNAASTATSASATALTRANAAGTSATNAANSAAAASTSATNAASSATAANTNATQAATSAASISPSTIARTNTGNFFTGTQVAPRFSNDTGAYFTVGAQGPVQNYDDQDYMVFNRTADTYEWRVSGERRLALSPDVVQMFTPLVLPAANPTAVTHAAHRGFVDAQDTATLNAARTYADGKVAGLAPIANPTFTGTVSLSTSGQTLGRVGQYNVVTDSADGWQYRFDVATGLRQWIRPGVIQLSLDYSGNLFAAGSVSGTSDERMKQVEGPVELSTALAFVENAKPTLFRMLNARMDGGPSDIKMGFIAQDIAAVPELASLVSRMDRPGMVANPDRGSPADVLLALDQGLGVTALLTLALKHALERIDALEDTLTSPP